MDMVHFIPPAQRRVVMTAAQSDDEPVLIFGASGTGKGAIAHWIHLNGPRATRPMMVADIEKPLAEQILAAQGGTLLISEIAMLPLGMQKILLQLLNTKTIRLPQQDQVPMLVNVRIIGTTSHSVEGRVQTGFFNSELFDRLSRLKIEMPPLVRRMDEFEDIVLGIVGEITRELHKEHIRQVTSEAWSLLKSYEWPGNLRELRNVLRLAVISASGDAIDAASLPELGSNRVDFRATREGFEKIYLLELLKTYSGDIAKTAQATRMDEDALVTKIEKYGLYYKGSTANN